MVAGSVTGPLLAPSTCGCADLAVVPAAETAVPVVRPAAGEVSGRCHFTALVAALAGSERMSGSVGKKVEMELIDFKLLLHYQVD